MNGGDPGFEYPLQFSLNKNDIGYCVCIYIYIMLLTRTIIKKKGSSNNIENPFLVSYRFL